MATLNVTDENFENEVIKSSKPTVVDFWAEWCGPCKQIAPTLEEISNEMSDEVVIAKHNIDMSLIHQPSMVFVAYLQCYFLRTGS